MSTEWNKAIVDLAKTELISERDQGFFERCYQQGLDIYRHRLKNIGFENLHTILDAGSGMGQWSIALAGTCDRVYSIESSADRVKAHRCLANAIGIGNNDVRQGFLEELPYNDSSFDAVFCYSVVYYTDYEQSFREIFRVLKPGGKLYFCTNGIGWYLHNILNRPNATADFDPRKMAIECLKNTHAYARSGLKESRGEKYMVSTETILLLEEIGFVDILHEEEGKIALERSYEPRSFFQGRYLDEEGIYEILCQKP